MNKQTIGSCSICSGAVTLPTYCCGANPPKPTCSSCGAVAKPVGPVIPMEQPKACNHDWIAGDVVQTCPACK